MLNKGTTDIRLARVARPTIISGATLLDWGLMLAAILLRIVGSNLFYGSFILLAIHAARGHAQAIQALFLSWLLVSLNNEIFGAVSNVELLRALIFVVVAFRVLLEALDRRSRIRAGSVRLPLIFFIGLCLANSLFVSLLPILSFLKTFLFGLMSLCVLGVWSRLGSERAKMEAWLLNALTAIAVISAPLPLAGMGYEVNDYGFQGILNQPQGFGIMLALLATWQLGRMLVFHQFSAYSLLRLGLFIALLYMSAARTGMLAFLLGTLGAFVIAWFSNRPDLRRVIAGMRRIVVLALSGTLVILLLIFASTIFQAAETAIFKGDTDTALAEHFENSRGQLIERSLENFREQPIFGNGFAMPSYRDDLEIVYDPIFGLPVSAPIEKGVLPAAVLEELGILGAAGFLWLIVSLLREVARKGEYHMIGLLIAALMINLGEAVLFSPSGFGLMIWLVIGMSVSSTARSPSQRAAIHGPSFSASRLRPL